MTSERSPHGLLAPLPVGRGPDDLATAAESLACALDGTGPAVVPVPAGPGGAAVLAMARTEVPLERDLDGDQVALVVPTSGSTGEPKGALLTAAALRASASATHERLGGPGQWLLCLPLTHIAGLQVVVRSLLAGTDPVALPASDRFRPDDFATATGRLDGARRYTALVPTQLRRLLDGPAAGIDALASYDAVLVGGAALPEPVRARAEAAGVRVVTTYGMSETCGGCVYDGVPLAGVQVEAPDNGPVRLGGAVVFSGYRLRPDLTAAGLVTRNGVRWHVTADIGRVEATELQIIGRVDELIVTGGENVAPEAVEAALSSHPAVRDVVVLGIADEAWGQRVVAVVVAADPAGPPTLHLLRTHAASVLPPYALPKRLELVTAIPLLPTGKPDRVTLRSALDR